MVYNINPQRLILLTGIFIVIFWNILSNYFGVSFQLFLIVLLLAFVLSSIRFKLKINKGNLVYQISLFNKSIMKKEIYPDQINQLEFIRVGWSKKAAIIKVNKGLNIRLAVLESPKAYEHLIDFGEKHDITIFKTKDYLILERMK